MPTKLERWRVVKVLETVLVVDGDQETRQTLKYILELFGYRTIEARNGIEALQILGEWGQDIHLALCVEDLIDMTLGQWRGQLRFLGSQIPTLIISDRDRNEIADLPVELAEREALERRGSILPSHIRLLERIRIALDEKFFANRAETRATAA